MADNSDVLNQLSAERRKQAEPAPVPVAEAPAAPVKKAPAPKTEVAPEK